MQIGITILFKNTLLSIISFLEENELLYVLRCILHPWDINAGKQLLKHSTYENIPKRS